MSMDSLIKDRVMYLERLCSEKEKALEHAPDGILRGVRHRKGFQYFQKKDGYDKSGTYIKAGNKELAEKLGQKDYDRRIQKAALSEISLWKKPCRFFADSKILTVEEIYDSLPLWEQAVVHPIRKPVEQFVKEWKDQTYKGLPFLPDDHSAYFYKGIRMRSMSEVMIAMLLDTYDIPFLYEKPLKLTKDLTVHPDFSTLDVGSRTEVYWEHMGMMDNPKYYQDAVQKISSYMYSDLYLGDRLIITQGTSYSTLDMREAEKLLCWRYGKQNLHFARKLAEK